MFVRPKRACGEIVVFYNEILRMLSATRLCRRERLLPLYERMKRSRRRQAAADACDVGLSAQLSPALRYELMVKRWAILNGTCSADVALSRHHIEIQGRNSMRR